MGCFPHEKNIKLAQCDFMSHVLTEFPVKFAEKIRSLDGQSTHMVSCVTFPAKVGDVYPTLSTSI